MIQSKRNTMLHAALWYADLGYAVFPCVPGEKRPLTEHGLLDASTDEEQIRIWWSERPDANVAIRTDGMVVIDIDGEGDTWMGDQHVRWDDMMVAPSSATPRGGRHYLFRQPTGKDWRNTEGRLAEKVDTRANGGYIVAPPSSTSNGEYVWVEGFELQVSRDRLPEPPGWLTEDLDRLSARKPVAVSPPLNLNGNHIAEGKRNGTLFRLGCSMRRVGFEQASIAAALRATNQDRCTPPLDAAEVESIAGQAFRYAPDEAAQATMLGSIAGDDVSAPLYPKSLHELITEFPKLRPPVVEGLLRRGETMNVISSSKAGKSWLVTDLALSVATGRPWLETYHTTAGCVLIIDNELHAESSAHRIPKVAEARGISLDLVHEKVFVLNLRGQLRDVFSLGSFFQSVEPGHYDVIVLDAFYRFMPRDMDENDNGTMAHLYNQLDRYADRLECAFVLIHHSTKGSQSGKAVTDVGAGAGSQSRATDTHLILRPHQEAGAVVLEAAVRSWPPIEPMVLRWEFPVWTPAPGLDPTELRQEKTRKQKEEPKMDKPKAPEWTAEQFVERYICGEPVTQAEIRESAQKEPGLSWRRIQDLLTVAEQRNLISRVKLPGRGGPAAFVRCPKELFE